MRNTVNHTQDSAAQAISDPQLVARAQAGDRDAFEELVGRHRSKIYRTAQFLCNGCTEDGEDTSQNALLKAYLHLKQFRGESQFSTWLTRIVVNECLIYQRKKRSRPQGPSLDDQFGPEGDLSLDLSDGSDDPEEQCGREEFRFVLQQALAATGERYRLAFVLSQIEGLSNRELAARLGVSIPTAKTRLLRARRQLRRALAETFCNGSRCYWPGAGPANGSRIRGRAGATRCSQSA